jgi:hypothetical protein
MLSLGWIAELILSVQSGDLLPYSIAAKAGNRLQKSSDA